MILVTGGTGLVGAHLLYYLLQKNSFVRATHRKSSDLEYIKDVFSYYTDKPDEFYNKIEWVEANLTDIPSLHTAFKGITHVYHAAAYISFNPKNLRGLRKTNVEGTANIVNLCLKYGIDKLCYVSSIATLGSVTNDDPVHEEIHWNSEEDNNVYAITKYGAEMEVWRGMQEGLKAVIVNPGVILGEGFWYSGSGTIIRNAAKGSKYYTQGGSGFVDVRDVVKAMMLLMKAQVSHERYVLVAENMSYKDLFTDLSHHIKVKPPQKLIGAQTLKWIARLDWLSSKLFGTKRKLLKSMIKSLTSNTTYSSQKIKTEHNFEFIPIAKTLERVAKNYSSKS
ncbi:MAG: NAD-dependent epimerase/dehydratase family protein [Flavobacteriaceae bacterium]|nr:NAD-dependent epimerase/dehydratase family protein [Flavobacteriaceae bacterium]